MSRGSFLLAHPVGDLVPSRELADQLFLLVDRRHLRVQVAGSLRQFGDRVDAGRFEQLGVLFLDSLDPEEVDVVDPAQDQSVADPGVLAIFFGRPESLLP